MGDAIKKERRGLVFQPDRNNTGPLAALHEARHGTLHEPCTVSATLLDEIRQWLADNLLKRGIHKVGEAAIDRANLTVKGDGKENVIKRINQIAIALLGAGDDLEELVQLFFTGRVLITVLHATHETAQFGDLLSLIPYVNAEENDQNYEADRKCFVMVRERTNRVPRRPGISHPKKKNDKDRHQPEFSLTLFKLLEAGRDYRMLVSLRRGAAVGLLGALVVFVHSSGRDPAESGVCRRKVP